MFDVKECMEWKTVKYEWFYCYIFKTIFLHAQLETPHKYAFLKYLWLPNARLVVPVDVTKVIIQCSKILHIWPSQVRVLWLICGYQIRGCLSSFTLKNSSHKSLTFGQCGHPGYTFHSVGWKNYCLIRKDEEVSGHGLNYVADRENPSVG